jgi:hypothetical protein
MPRPLSRAQHAQNHAFLRELGRHGNVREACRALGIHRATLTKRRAKHPAFAAAWDAALARLAGEGTTATRAEGEPRIIRRGDGTLQRRRLPPGPIDRAAERRFLSALSFTASKRLAARAAGFTHSAFHQHARANPAFARDVHWALTERYDPRELALIAGVLPDDYPDDGLATDPLAALMMPEEALRLLFRHGSRVTLPPPPGDPRARPVVLDATALARERTERHRRWVEGIVAKLWRAAEHIAPGPPEPPVRE